MTQTPQPPAAGTPAPADGPASTGGGTTPHRPVVLAAMMLAMFMAAVEATIVATALPTIVAELGGFQWFSWVFAIYLLTQAVMIPIYGRLSDMYGRKPVFYAGASLFLAGSVACGFAGSMGQLIAFRAVQGAGAGAVHPLALTVVGDIYPGAERARVQGWISSVWAFASVTGPGLGAFLVQQVHWSLVFWVNVPVGLLSMGLLAAFLAERVERRPHRIDYLGSALMMLATSALMLALIQASRLPWPVLGALGVLAVLALAGFLRVEGGAAEPMMPLDLWRDRMIVLGNAGALATGALMMGVTSFLPSYVQGAMGRSPAVAGFTLAVMSIGWPLASTLGGRALVHTSYRVIATLGGAALIAGAATLIALTPERGPLWAGAGTFLIGAGMGFSNTAYLVAIQTTVAWQRRGAATSSHMFMRIMGQSLGASALGAVVNLGLHAYAPGEADVVNQLMTQGVREGLDPARLASLGAALAQSLHHVYVIAGVLALVALGVGLGYPRGLNPTRGTEG